MIESWREWLYPLGYAAQAAFAWRFLQQWITSEIEKKSIVNASFWRLSFVGNVMFLIHSFIQLQFHVCAIQISNAIIAWRNLNLMNPENRKYRTRFVIFLMIAFNVLLAGFFILQAYLWDNGNLVWFRMPTWNGETVRQVGEIWHLVGWISMILFSSRFWVQWWQSEMRESSYVSPAFWWLSLIGAFLMILYFGYIGDPVNIVGPAIGIIPYTRNLMLIYKNR